MRLPKFRFTIKGIQQERKTVIIASVLVLALVAVLSVGLFLVFRKPVYEEELNREAGSDARVVSQEASVAVGDALNVAAEPVVTNITTEEEEERQAAIATVESEYQRLGIVQCSSYINFRTKPDQNDLTNIQGMLANGAAVDILDDAPEGTDGWLKVRSGGMTGYVSKQFIVTGADAEALIPALVKKRATVVTEKLRMRSTPEIVEGNTVGSAAKGEKYEVLGFEGEDWIRIEPDNIDNISECYMSAKPENVSIGYGLDEARTLDLRQKVLNMYDHLGVSLASDYINVRSDPKEDGIKNIVGKLPGYAGANIVGEKDGWYQIESGGVKGYVRADLLATGKEAEALATSHAHVMAIVNTDALNVRSEPTTDSKAWTKITTGQRYDVLNQMDGWVQIDLDSGDDEDIDQGAYVSTRDNNVSVLYALSEAIDYHPATDAANAAAKLRSDIVNYACQFVGNPYVWGGTSLTHGADCSGFTQSVLRHFGISVPRVSRTQANTGVKVTSKNMRPGDLIFYANKSGTINHVGMYIGNGQVVNAASRRSGIRIYRWNYRTPVAIRNVIGN